MQMLANFHVLGVPYLGSPHIGGVLSNPTLIVIHYTGSGGADGNGDVGWFKDPNSKVSAHFVVGRDGIAIQCVPLNRKAQHAGKSIWKGRAFCNGFSIGIEVDNWGLLTKAADGKFYPPVKNPKPIPASQVVEINGKYWERFTQEQIDKTAELVAMLKKNIPTLTDIAGHRDIAPGRKIDPGDAWPMRAMHGVSNGRADTDMPKATVIASSLRVREAGSATAKVIGKLSSGTEVLVKYDDPQSGWSLVEPVVPSFLKGINEGWVSSQFLQKHPV